MKNKNDKIKKIKQLLLPIFKKYPAIKLAYFFGSQVRDEAGPISDYDFAVYTNEKDKKKNFDLKLDILTKLNKVLKTDHIDLVVLNTTESPELKYNIIKEGELIYEREPYKVLVEPKILNEYFDFHTMLLKYNLTKA